MVSRGLTGRRNAPNWRAAPTLPALWRHVFHARPEMFDLFMVKSATRMIERHVMTKYALVSTVILALVTAGCARTEAMKESADREVYELIESRAPEVQGMMVDFTIDEDRILDLSEFPVVEETEEFLGEFAQAEEGAAVISLEDALRLAFSNNRSYQNQREVLYLTALDLTLERHQYTPRPFGSGSVTYAQDRQTETRLSPQAEAAQMAPGLVQDIGELAGTPAALLGRYTQIVESAGRVSGITEPSTNIYTEERLSGSTRVGADMLMRGGAQIAVDLTSSFLRFLTGDPRTSTSSALVGSIRQPLLRGAGREIAAESLTQRERDLLYQLRSFTRFRQEFAIDVAAAYYRVLQQRDAARNNWLGYQSFLQGAERQRALAEAGRVTETDLGRSIQAELSQEDSWNSSVQSYRDALDQFKITLGLSTDVALVLDDQELDNLREQGLIHPDIDLEEAIDVARASRLDFYTDRDQVEDSARRVRIAADNLRHLLDIRVSGEVPSEPGDNFQNLDFRRAEWDVGLDLGLRLDNKPQRNAYRSAVINYERALRSLELAEDNIKLDVRQALRNLEQAERSYLIREIGVEVNERRVEEQELLAEAGRATTLDQIDANNDLVAARNSLTAALVDHTLARLSFWRDVGLLHIKQDGQWEELTDADVI